MDSDTSRNLGVASFFWGWPVQDSAFFVDSRPIRKFGGGKKDQPPCRSDVYDHSEFKVISQCCYTNCCYPNCSCTNCDHFTWIYLSLPVFTCIYLNLPVFTWIHPNLHKFTWIYLNLPEFTWIYRNGPEWTWIYFGSLGLILVDLGDFGYRVENLEYLIHPQRISRMPWDPTGSNNKMWKRAAWARLLFYSYILLFPPSPLLWPMGGQISAV